MREPAWKKLVEDLRDSGHQSVYLDRLRDRLNVWQSQDDLRREILREMASALGRSEERVCLALLKLELIGRDLTRLSDGGGDGASTEEVGSLIDAYNAQRKAAVGFLWELTIHREALGFRRNDILREFYPIPPAKKRAAG